MSFRISATKEKEKNLLQKRLFIYSTDEMPLNTLVRSRVRRDRSPSRNALTYGHVYVANAREVLLTTFSKLGWKDYWCLS